jgi:hypothetical protein
MVSKLAVSGAAVARMKLRLHPGMWLLPEAHRSPAQFATIWWVAKSTVTLSKRD